MIRNTLVLALVLVRVASAQDAASDPVPPRLPAIAAAVERVSKEDVEATIRALAGFGTRHTLSDTRSEARGIGAARRWLLARMDADFRGFVAYAAVDCGGDIVLSRSAIALRSLVLWRAWDVTPMPKRHFVRFLTDYTRHCLSRPLNLGQVDLSLAHARRAG